MENTMAQLTIWQRKQLSKYLAKRKAQRLAKKSSIFKFNFFSWLKNFIK